MRGMSSPDMNRILEKIRASGCLTQDELRRQVTMVHGWQALLRVDEWDRWWNGEVERHVCRAARLGGRHLPTASGAVAFGLFGILFAGYGVWLLGENSQSMGASPLVPRLACGLLAAACLFFFQMGFSIWKIQNFKPMLKTYEDGRGAELGTLDTQHRPGARFCLKCLKYTH